MVYNAYRVMPEYVIKYHGGSDTEYMPPGPVASYHHINMARFGMFRRLALRRASVARRISAQFPSTSPYPAVYHSTPPPPPGAVVCPHQRTVPAPGSLYYGGPSNHFPMSLVPVLRSPPAMHCQAQACFGIQPMLQSQTPPSPVPYPPKSS